MFDLPIFLFPPIVARHICTLLSQSKSWRIPRLWNVPNHEQSVTHDQLKTKMKPWKACSKAMWNKDFGDFMTCKQRSHTHNSTIARTTKNILLLMTANHLPMIASQLSLCPSSDRKLLFDWQWLTVWLCAYFSEPLKWCKESGGRSAIPR